MVDYLEQIKELEEELRTTPYNKRTQHHIGLVKAKIARLREKHEKRIKGKKKGEGYSVRKSGDASVVILGYPSVGKSTLLNQLTNANSLIGHYAFTTLTVIPGLLEYNHAKIQILDMPGVVKGAALGTGRGKEVLSVIRSADLVLILIEVSHPEHLKVLLKEVHDSKIRLNQERPDVRIRKTARGGVRVGSTLPLNIPHPTIAAILKEFRINNAEVLIRSVIDEDQLIDVIEGNRVYLPGIVVLNKIDTIDEKTAQRVKRKTKADISISAQKKMHIEELKGMIFNKLNFIRIYLKEPGQPADLEEPLVMFKNATIKSVCEKLHKDFVEKFRFARLWSRSARFDGQKLLRLDHKLEDKDVLEIHIR